MNVKIQVSPGELIDKITILEIKAEEITDESKQRDIHTELNLLISVLDTEVTSSERLSGLRSELKMVNKEIWNSENEVREFWEDDAKCLAAARRSHHRNDERARIKREINVLLGSHIVEVKSLPEYRL